MNEIDRFLAEDIGAGDITTESIVPLDQVSRAVIVAKEETVIAGHDFVRRVFESLDNRIDYHDIIKDGETAHRGDTVSKISGRTRAILTGERVALNIFQRLSGIASSTKRFVDAAGVNTKVKIIDTRKTCPGLRAMEKYAVRMGGGENHRFDLAEMALIKENHIAAAGSIREAVRRIREKSSVAIEVEVKSMDELAQASQENVDRIMLDNWPRANVGQAVAFIGGRIPIEVSGNMTPEKVKALAGSGIDYISVGAITHSFRSADLSLLIL
jgi:nicotinate-nucleotide pyrophosphorylase (carboxylating)